MKTIQELVDEYVGSSYKTICPVYQSNDWYIAYKSYDAHSILDASNFECIILGDCRIIKKKILEFRKYELIENIEPPKFITFTSKSAIKWILFYKDRVEIRTMGNEAKLMSVYDLNDFTSNIDSFSAGALSIPFRNGKQEIKSNKEYKKLILDFIFK